MKPKEDRDHERTEKSQPRGAEREAGKHRVRDLDPTDRFHVSGRRVRRIASGR